MASETERAEASAHYAGTTSQGGPIGFDLVGGGRTVTNLMFTVDAFGGKPGDVGFADAPIAITGLFPVSADGRFGGTVEAQQTTVELEGVLNGSETVRGTLRVDVILVYRGTPRRCSSGHVDWSALLVSPAC